MTNNETTDKLIKKLEKVLQSKMRPVFEGYDQSIGALLIPMRWKPMVLVIGNFSSGKSTFINEFLGRHVQRTGQAPTDDSFTVISLPENPAEERTLPGSTIMSDERLPFTSLRRFGEKLFAHLRLKEVNSEALSDIAIIDTPGMLDSVTEKDRGYDYLAVVGELARLADMIILMFDPHKAGTIKETYQAIRSTLPGATGEDRVFYVMNRIDECDNIADLVKSFGTLCWNLSQMTGRKDIPRIYLTYAESEKKTMEGLDAWINDRNELKQAVTSAPRLRLNHIFEEVDRGVREISLQIEALATFREGFFRKLGGAIRYGCIAALALFFFGDLLLNQLIGFPSQPLVYAAFSPPLDWEQLILPVGGSSIFLVLLGLAIKQFSFPRYLRQELKNIDKLVTLETAYRKDLWGRSRPQVERLLTTDGWSMLWKGHRRALHKIERFLEKDLRALFEQSNAMKVK